MAVTYYYGDPRQFQGFTSVMRDDNSLLDYWFYPNRVYMDEVRKENIKVEEENKKKEKDKKEKDKKGKGGAEGGSGDGGGKKKGGGNEGGDKEKEKGGKKEPDNKPKVIELKVPLCCEACARKVIKKIEKLEGVVKGVICDLYENKVVLKATTKPEIVLKQARKVKKDAELWPQKKKEPEKKDGKKKDDKGKDKEKDDENED